MMKAFVCSLFTLHFACAQVLQEDIPGLPITHGSTRPRPSDPVSSFLSGLGNLFLDIDETFSRQLAPKVNAEDSTKEQMYGRPRSGASYFNRIRENYRDVQKRLGESLGKLDLRMSSGLGSVNIQNEGLKSDVDVSLPFLPMNLAVKSGRRLKTSDNDVGVTEAVNIKPEETSPHFRSSFKLGNTEINTDANIGSLQPSELLKNVENQIKKVLEDIKVTDGTIDAQTKENAQEKGVNDGSELESEFNSDIKEISPRSGSNYESSEPSQIDDSNVEGRILGDVLYSESTFDKLTKRVMRDAKWMIDPKAFPSRIVETMKQISDKATENIKAGIADDRAPKKTDATISKVSQQEQESVKQDIKKRKALNPLNNNLDAIIVDEKINIIPQSNTNVKFEFQDNRSRKDSIILAFTPEGVPLKLRMGPEVLNPLKFLDKALRTYRVSLNIPVTSYDDIEPVGREILQLGTGSGGTMTRALYIDLSDSFQLESLLRTLRRTKMLQEVQSEGAD